MLWAQHLYLISIHNLVVEVDASYIKGMLCNPDIQPNAVVNHWIATILLFNFKLIHIPADKHHGPDGLSRHEPAPGEDEEDNPKDWVDQVLSLSIWVVSWLDACSANSSRAAALTLAFETNNDKDTNSIPTRRPCRDRHLPARYCMDKYIANNSARPPIQLRHNVSNNNNNTVSNNNNNTASNNAKNNNIIDTTNNNTHNNSSSLLSPDPQNPNHLNNDSDTSDDDSDDSAPVKFLTSDKANKMDQEIEQIHRFLLSRCVTGLEIASSP